MGAPERDGRAHRPGRSGQTRPDADAGKRGPLRAGLRRGSAHLDGRAGGAAARRGEGLR